MRRVVLLLLTLLLPLTLAAPASATVQMPTARHPRIVIKNFGFTGDLVVRRGVRVKVVNRDGVEHTLTHRRKGHFDTGPIPANGGVRFFRAPKRLGKYPFGCQFHPDMHGTLIVRRG